MSWIMDAGALLLGRDLAVEVPGHALELRDHGLDLGDFAPLLVYLEFLQANERLTRFHRLTPRRPIRPALHPAAPGGRGGEIPGSLRAQR